jgi:hypothetical protein
MNDAACVSYGQCVSHLQSDQQGALQLQRAPANQLPDVLSFDVLHGDEVHAVDDVHVIDSANVGMVQRRSQPCFTLKASEVGLSRGQFGGQHLDHHGAAQLGVGGFIDCALSADADLFRNVIIAQGLADHDFCNASPQLAIF